MRNIRQENVSEHSLQVAFVAHALAVIKIVNLMAMSTPSVLHYKQCIMMPVRLSPVICQLLLNTTIHKLLMNIKNRKTCSAKID